ncbi:MAG: epimerase [Anaerolineaceae bacterium 4572_5.1]|nr:MAG: epimerase [Anaerolineaceae bacterium 4572_5.1]
MLKKTTLITGVCGEIGQALLETLAEKKEHNIVTFDLKPLPKAFQGKSTHIEGDILDKSILAHLANEYEFEVIYHMAALLSTTGEKKPLLAHEVNACGTIALMEIASKQSRARGERVKFIFPSSIAAYGLPDLKTKTEHYYIGEKECTEPTTMYGCTKLYCEKIGNYYSEYLLQLAEEAPVRMDFRSLRFPGLISAFTVPSGGTSDFGPEMLHAAAQNKPYACFVRRDVRIPFMVMPDAVKSLITLANAPLENLSTRVYNVTSFSLSAEDFEEQVQKYFPNAEITFEPDLKRQAIVDSWPADLNDDAARKDWGWKPDYDVTRAFEEYLVPNIRKRYR